LYLTPKINSFSKNKESKAKKFQKGCPDSVSKGKQARKAEKSCETLKL
jgi:hypothetical protein